MSAPGLRFQVVDGLRPSRRFLWRLVDGDGTVLTEASRGYPSREACLDVVAGIIEHAATAGIEDLTDVGRAVIHLDRASTRSRFVTR